MLNYYDFIFEKFINESYVYYIDEFKNILVKLSKDNQIAKDLLEVEFTDSKSDTTFISLGKRDGYIGFSTMRNTLKNVEKYFGDNLKNKGIDSKTLDNILNITTSKIEKGETSKSDVNYLFNEFDLGSKSRSEIKLGKFINAVLPGKYTSVEIEDFTNKFKALIGKIGENFSLVSGEDIEFWYDSENYAEMKGTLGSSCMAGKKRIFSIYVDNPEVCKLLILEEDDKLLGRALVWKLSSINYYGKSDNQEEVWFMDRQYTIKESDVEKFRNYAKEKGWVYKANNNHHSFSEVVIDGVTKNVEMTVELESKNHNRFPYMDTFRRFDPYKGILYNDEKRDGNFTGNYILDKTNGGYEEIKEGIWSEYYSEIIPEEYAIWSDVVDSYLHEDNVVWVNYGDHQGAYPEEHDDLCYDEWDEEWIHIGDAIYSGVYDYYIKKDHAIKVVDDVYSNGEPNDVDYGVYHTRDSDIIKKDDLLFIRQEDTDGRITIKLNKNILWYHKLSKDYLDWRKAKGVHKNILTKDSDENYILKILKVSIYKVDLNNPISEVPKDLGGIEWLLKEDAILLGWDVTREEKVVDLIWYNDSIKSLIPELKSIADNDEKFFNIIKKFEKTIRYDIIRSIRKRRIDLVDSSFIYNQS
jgi:hypothetical protein